LLSLGHAESLLSEVRIVSFDKGIAHVLGASAIAVASTLPTLLRKTYELVSL
jgi:hypothetical protein